MDTFKKGQKKEKLCADDLQAEGYTRILFRSQRIRFGRIDFGPFDVVAAKKGAECRVSCTHEGHTAEKMRAVEQYIDECLTDEMRKFILCKVWTWFPAKWRGRGKNKVWVSAHWEKGDLGV